MSEQLQKNIEDMSQEREMEIRGVFAQMAFVGAGLELADKEQSFNDRTGNIVLGYN